MGLLGLRLRNRGRERTWIGGIEPHSGVGIEKPTVPTFGITNLRPEGPPTCSPIHQLGRLVLPGGNHYLQADTQQRLLSHFLNACASIAGPRLRFTDNRDVTSRRRER